MADRVIVQGADTRDGARPYSADLAAATPAVVAVAEADGVQVVCLYSLDATAAAPVTLSLWDAATTGAATGAATYRVFLPAGASHYQWGDVGIQFVNGLVVSASGACSLSLGYS